MSADADPNRTRPIGRGCHERAGAAAACFPVDGRARGSRPVPIVAPDIATGDAGDVLEFEVRLEEQFEERERVGVERAGEVEIFGDVETALPALDLGDIGLGLAEPRGDLRLRQPSGAPERPQEREKAPAGGYPARRHLAALHGAPERLALWIERRGSP